MNTHYGGGVMLRVQAVAQTTRRLGVTVALVLAGCEQKPATAPSTAGPDVPAHEIGSMTARAIALAMAEAPIRQQILSDLRDSPISEHKVLLQDYLSSPKGKLLLAAIERAGINSDSLGQALKNAGPIQFYVPVTAHRVSWRGTADVLVVPNLTSDESQLAFTPTGATVSFDMADGVPSGTSALFVLQWAEPMFRRWAGPTAATETIQEAGESQIGSGTAEHDASGRIVSVIDATRDGPRGLFLSHGGESVSSGTYANSLTNVDACDGPLCDDIEIEFRSTVYGTANRYVSAQITGLARGEVWRGLLKVHDARAVSGTSIIVEVWELDGTSGDDAFYCQAIASGCDRSVSDWVYLNGSGWGPFELCADDPSRCGPFPAEHPGAELRVTFADRAPPVVSTVTVSPSTATADVGLTVSLSATASDQYGDVMTGKTATWTSSNTSIATVGSTGVVRGVDGGQATITATIDGVNGTATIDVRNVARPNSLVENPGAWIPEPLWNLLDDSGGEVSASLCCHQQKTFTVGLPDVVDPQTSVGHIIRARARISATTDVGDIFRIELLQGAVVKATTTFWSDLSNNGTVFSYTLREDEANSITDYTDLRLRVIYSLLQDQNVTAYVDWVQFEWP
jgi:hypothetical protein